MNIFATGSGAPKLVEKSDSLIAPLDIIDNLKQIVRAQCDLHFLERKSVFTVYYRNVGLVSVYPDGPDTCRLQVNPLFYKRYNKLVQILLDADTNFKSSIVFDLVKSLKIQTDIELNQFPVIFVSTAQTRPNQILIAAVTGAVAARFIHFVSYRVGRLKKLYLKTFRIISKHYIRHGGSIRGFGEITGYTLWLSNCVGVRFDTRGRLLGTAEGVFHAETIEIQVL
ncbi:hypothetical protein [Fundidesulfovibrio soli]|uniref:hypothetical protein n=1 Tax=Fundidesulfovibrio soli TaxID=2922716 RepID=UPI001FAF347A|nr:hypothetical protein [Fundidesulfovibrio soli]